MLKADSDHVSIEQVCVWRESGIWLDHEKAMYIGFTDETLRDVLSKHEYGKLNLSANVDSARQDLDVRIGRDYKFVITWHRLAGSYLADGRGTCEVQGVSYERFRGTMLNNLNWPAHGDTRAPDGSMVDGYHRLTTNIFLKKHEAESAWALSPNLGSQKPGGWMPDKGHADFFHKRSFLGITICAEELKLHADAYFDVRPDGSRKNKKRLFAEAIRSAWDNHAKSESKLCRAGEPVFFMIKSEGDADRLAARCGAYLAEIEKRGWLDFPRSSILEKLTKAQ